jgi:hypothetical protein
LVIAKSIAELHEGGLELESTPGEGTSVRFWIPGVATAEEVAERAADDQSAFTGSRLWNDDEIDDLDIGAD